jgi:Tol biopolymer transport system component
LAKERHDFGIWSVRVNEKTGESAGEPVQITKGVGRVGGLSITADGKRLLLWRDNFQPTVFLSEIDSRTREFKAPRRLTFDENTNAVTAWTPDSRAVVFSSNRNGTFKLFRQAIDQTVPEVLVEGRNIFQPRLSPDGTEILYLAGYVPEDPTQPVRLMAIPVAGGAPRLVLQTPLIGDIQCARSPSQLCLLVSDAPPAPQVFSFDPKNGTMQPFSPLAGITFENWGLSPDGSQIALVHGRFERKITFMRLNDATKREVEFNGFIQGMDWAADSKSVFVTSWAANGASEVVGVGPGGDNRVLLKRDHGQWYLWAIPSPDGRYAALMVLTGQNNAWMVENF